jgi:hypothetical protein
VDQWIPTFQRNILPAASALMMEVSEDSVFLLNVGVPERPYDVTTQETNIDFFTAVRTSGLI